MAEEKIIFTNGCFDILHVGHVRYLEAARRMGDTLIVGLNSDRSFQEVKGRSPVTPQDERFEILTALWSVNEVILFDDPTPLALIEKIRPDILVKGFDHDPKTVVGREYAKEVICLDVGTGMHSAQIIKRVQKLFHVAPVLRSEL